MADLIDRGALLASLPKEWTSCSVSAIIDAPRVDAVEVVRCRDCANFDPNTCGLPFGLCLVWEQYTESTGFCSHGVRREK